MPDIALLLDAHATIAESLLWEPGEGVLYWVDIRAPALFRLDPRTLENRRWDLPEDIGAFCLLENGKTALVALRSGLFALSTATGSLERVAAAPWDPARYRFNEGAVDSDGRFWVGCMFDPKPGHEGEPAPGPLHSWTTSTGLVHHPYPARCHNGMGWSPDGGTFYVSDLPTKTISAFFFADGRLGERRVFAELDGPGVPDGAAVDEEGAYWCAVHGGGALQRFAPDGTLLDRIELPVSQPTMCAFGGPDLRTLYISSAAQHLERRTAGAAAARRRPVPLSTRRAGLAQADARALARPHALASLPFSTTVCGLDELEGLCDARATHVLSILDPDWPVPEAFGAYGEHEKLELRFHDVIEDTPGQITPRPEHVEALLHFGRDLGEGDHLLVHCHAGISRSTASMALIIAQAMPDLPAPDVLEAVLAIREKAWPNLRMLEMGDAMLGRGGTLVAAAHDVYRRQVQRRPFLWDFMSNAGRARELATATRPEPAPEPAEEPR